MNPLREVIRHRIGLTLRSERTASLNLFAAGRAEALGLADVGAYARWLRDEPLAGDEWRGLVAVVTNGHTAFCRDMEQLSRVVEALSALRRGRTLQVWSCACSTGEEAYTLAMLALEHELDLEVLGTDINVEALSHAERGQYRDFALRRVPPAWRSRYFQRRGEFWEPSPDVAALVRFAPHNLLDPSYPHALTGGWDMILCRNVFIYLDDEAIARGLRRFDEVLAPDGLLFVSHTDMLTVETTDLNATGLGRRLRYRNPSESAPPSVPRARPVVTPVQPPTAAVEPPGGGPGGGPGRGLLEAVATQDYAGAEALLSEADTRDDVVIGMITGNLRLARHDFEGAARAYDAAHDLDPLRAEVHYLRGLVYRRTGELERAVDSCRRALFLDPRLWPASFLLASLHERLGARARSRAEYRHALDLVVGGPRRPPLLSYLPGLDDLFPGGDDVEAACRFHLGEAGSGPPAT